MESFGREEQEHRWQEMAARVDKLVDNLYTPVDEGIKATIFVLYLLGFPTTMSCEGHPAVGRGGPWVEVGAQRPRCL
jgi:hypothetical protein